MTSALRRTALTAALVALSGSALADVVVSIDFNDLGSKLGPNDAPVELRTERDFNFSGAFLYAPGMLKAGDPKPDDLTGVGGFLSNVNRGGTTFNSIVLSLESLILAATKTAAPGGPSAASAFPNQFISAISFSLFTDSNSPRVSYVDTNNQAKSQSPTGGGTGLWAKNAFNFDPLDQVSTLTFTAGAGFFALDNLSITLTAAGNGGGGGNAPEPAGYALVGLALLAAGSASRRRGS